MNNKEEQQILASKKLEPATVWHFFLKNDWNNQSIV